MISYTDDRPDEADDDEPLSGLSVPVFAISDLRKRIGLVADRFYGSPSRALFVIGVTGTNGKTTCTQMLARILDRPSARCAVIGTLGSGFPDALESAEHTTPDAVTVHRLLAGFLQAGATRVCMEVSSHALEQQRVAGVAFDVAVFTNLSRDHLDYHGDMNAYAAAKAQLFALRGLRAAVINVGDPAGVGIRDALAPGVKRLDFALGENAVAGIAGRLLRADASGIELEVRTGDQELRIGSRLLGAPAVLLTLAGFGALQGLQDMRTPLAIAATANLVNAALDPLLIFGWGPVPAFGVAGAAWASTLGHWIGGLWAVAAVRQRLGLSGRVPWAHAPGLLVVGRDLFLRTGLLMGFLLLATRTANLLGAEAGAAHQAARQMWVLTAFLLDSYATTAQSLVAYFRSTSRPREAMRVAAIAYRWGVGSGLALVGVMLLGEGFVARLLVPPDARSIFSGAWWMLALAMPLNAISFVPDGIHWGTRAYRYLRNVMLGASAGGALLLWALSLRAGATLTSVWLITGIWISVRAVFGSLRVWPGIGQAPLASFAGPRAR